MTRCQPLSLEATAPVWGRPGARGWTTAETSVRPLSDREFASFRRLIREATGIHLSEAKRALVSGRLTRRVRELSLNTFSQYLERVNDPSSAEKALMIDRITTNETHFFREPQQFRFLEERVLPHLAVEAEAGRHPRRVRVWSAACSTGEEAYSLAMVLLRRFGATSGWTLEIVASDVSTRVLRAAEEGIWPLAKAHELQRHYLQAFMLRGRGPREGWMAAGPEIRSLVQFRYLNLNDRDYGPLGTFDLIFCRNVLIYFDGPTKGAVVSRLLRRLNPGGLLFLGHAESIANMGARPPVRSVGPNVYLPHEETGETKR